MRHMAVSQHFHTVGGWGHSGGDRAAAGGAVDVGAELGHETRAGRLCCVLGTCVEVRAL